MARRLPNIAAWLCAAALGVAALATPPRQEPPPPAKLDYARDIEPLLKNKCWPCHGKEFVAGGLDLEDPNDFVAGGSSGPAVVPGDAARSPLVQRMRGEGGLSQMPLSGVPFPKETIDLIARWIDEGASLGEGKPAFPRPQAGEAVGFDPKVWAVLKAHCLVCHGKESPSGGLNLESAESLSQGGVSGPAVFPGDSAKSVIVRRIRGLDGKPQMPPGFAPLEPEKVKVITDWIDAGAKAGKEDQHWSYRPPVRPVPPPDPTGWARNAVDQFVLAAMGKQGLEPQPEAPRETLLRRVALDLTGLPPTVEELDAFLADKDDGAYERQVDRLLASPHFGERQAVFWLDLARYADTHGYEADRTRTAWPYRDWVIRAFNENMPFDRFTHAQVAGDMLPGAGIPERVATGFLRNSMFNEEGGVDPAEAHHTVLTERADTVAKVWLGTSLACARCHDHKYDPVTIRDYYAFVAYFSRAGYEKRGDPNVGQEKWYEPVLPLPTPETAAAMEKARAALAEAERGAAQPDASRFEAWKARLGRERLVEKPADWSASSARGAALRKEPDGSWSVQGPALERDQTTLSADLPAGVTGVVLEALPDPTLPRGGPGRSSGGNFIVTGVEAALEGKPVPIEAVAASFSQQGYDPSALAYRRGDAWAVYPEPGKPHRLVVQFASPVGPGRLSVQVAQESPAWPQHVLGRFRVWATTSPRPAELAAQPRLAGADDAALHAAFALVDGEARAARARLEQARAAVAKASADIPATLVVAERAGDGPPAYPVFHRGEWTSPGELVTAAPPAVLGGEAHDRLGLARWLTAPQNPLTARVHANRLWAQLFGRGIVTTLEDFGTQGQRPSHPELLDWLAVEYAESGWDTKALLRQIVTSSTYRQSSSRRKDDPDPDNVWLARGPRVRLEAEAIRDALLVASGALDRTVGGPSVFPYQPEGVWNSPYSGEAWTPSTGGDAFRRGLYTFWKRTALYPAFAAFDAPSRESCTSGRPRTNTPLQALALLNDPFVADLARRLAQRAMAAGTNDRARFRFLFRACTSREPRPAEAEVGLRLLASARTGRDEAAAWSAVATAVMNLDETITKG